MILLGKLHPLVVHFPIALLAGALVLAIWARWRGHKPELVAPLLALGALGTLGAVGTGLALAEEQEFFGYMARQLERHRLLGFVGAGTAIAAALLARRRPVAGLVMATLATMVVGVGAHFGGMMVHGDDYWVLTPQPPKRVGVAATDPRVAAAPIVEDLTDIPETVTYTEVRPILQRSCERCHDGRKRKGGLRLDRRSYAFAGGEGGPALVPGDREGSLLYKRVALPRDHDDYMPSKGEPLTDAEVEMLGRWVDQGAVWTGS